MFHQYRKIWLLIFVLSFLSLQFFLKKLFYLENNPELWPFFLFFTAQITSPTMMMMTIPPTTPTGTQCVLLLSRWGSGVVELVSFSVKPTAGNNQMLHRTEVGFSASRPPLTSIFTWFYCPGVFLWGLIAEYMELNVSTGLQTEHLRRDRTKWRSSNWINPGVVISVSSE